MRDTGYQIFRSLLVFLTLAASQYLLVIKFYYSTCLSHLHCRYPLRAFALEREITTHLISSLHLNIRPYFTRVISRYTEHAQNHFCWGYHTFSVDLILLIPPLKRKSFSMPTGWWSTKKANDDASTAKVSVYAFSWGYQGAINNLLHSSWNMARHFTCLWLV
jgi:hypothetical protein